MKMGSLPPFYQLSQIKVLEIGKCDSILTYYKPILLNNVSLPHSSVQGYEDFNSYISGLRMMVAAYPYSLKAQIVLLY